MKAIVFLGIQGSGKGTQAMLLSRELGYQHVNIGDLLRAQIAASTPMGQKVQSIIEAGKLVSDDLIFELLEEAIDHASPGIIFDGFPRTLVQAEHLSDYYLVSDVIYLDINEEAALARMTSRLVCERCKSTYNQVSKKPARQGICDVCGGHLVQRKDDSPAAIRLRFEAFHRETYPLIRYFEAQSLLRKVDAKGEIEAVAKRVLSALSNKR